MSLIRTSPFRFGQRRPRTYCVDVAVGRIEEQDLEGGRRLARCLHGRGTPGAHASVRRCERAMTPIEQVVVAQGLPKLMYAGAGVLSGPSAAPTGSTDAGARAHGTTRGLVSAMLSSTACSSSASGFHFMKPAPPAVILSPSTMYQTRDPSESWGTITMVNPRNWKMVRSLIMYANSDSRPYTVRPWMLITWCFVLTLLTEAAIRRMSVTEASRRLTAALSASTDSLRPIISLGTVLRHTKMPCIWDPAMMLERRLKCTNC